ncbi:phosphate/phosphite/phosphonate ABC transporter substrate-binding protein [Serpentinicella sp. ANB-PHB4]|uniref:phosphate/phosphite/phosphonate ABC transporter substrate-binding protein n=1 Tax=Serpentinicella sp. ANB-PHB4 TaxID=3074076 RepID=UPI0028548EBA|nr:phosphate/phosphite/phosphonate ABC transporter substrate-binding protein [Serpentinicella sp. ANB-PHB4]MDR5659739.1 phosphate/phosphite/phosphonate ABC transporter substrate-binding protein [Serpentinicella sp. ANB-PHB4]
MKKIAIVLVGVLLMLSLVACTGGSKETATEITKLTMGFVPSSDADGMADTVKPLEAKLSEVLGVPVEAQIMVDYTALVEGMRTQHVDIGFLPPFGFVQAEERANVEVILKSVRHGSSSYKAQYNVRADSDIETIEDLAEMEGLVWAYADPTSTSGFLFPASQLMDLGVEDLDRHFQHINTQSHDNALIALYEGEADVATTFDDARTRIEGDYPDALEKIRVLGYTEPIPNDTISVRSELPEEWKTKITEAFLNFNDDEEMIAVMDQVYQWSGIEEAASEDYDIVRETYARFEEQLSN